MPTVRVIGQTETTMEWKVSGLSYPARDYDKFKIEYWGGDIDDYETWYSNESANATQVKITGLEPNTRYTGEIFAMWKGEYISCGTASAYTDEEPVTPPTLNSIRITNITTTSFDYEIRHSWGDYFNISVRNRDTGELVYARYNTNYSYDTVDGLEPNTRYKIQASVHNDGGEDSDYEFVTTDRPPQLPNPNVSISPSVSSATFSWSRPTGASVLVCTVKNELTGAQTTRNFDAYNSPQTITGLSPNQRHRVWFRYEPSSANSDRYSPSDTVEAYFTTVPKPTFYWSVSFSSGTNFNIPASDWNNLCTVVNEWRKLKGYSNYSFTKAYSDSPITASMYNQVITALSSITSSGLPSTVRVGDYCYASEFKKFATVINNLNI